jgi:hypothetical protein
MQQALERRERANRDSASVRLFTSISRRPRADRCRLEARLSPRRSRAASSAAKRLPCVIARVNRPWAVPCEVTNRCSLIAPAVAGA